MATATSGFRSGRPEKTSVSVFPPDSSAPASAAKLPEQIPVRLAPDLPKLRAPMPSPPPEPPSAILRNQPRKTADSLALAIAVSRDPSCSATSLAIAARYLEPAMPRAQAHHPMPTHWRVLESALLGLARGLSFAFAV